MVYGSAAINDVPWETVIKVYRQELGDQAFDSVEDYADHFLEYLAANDTLFTEERKKKLMLSQAARLYGHVRAAMIRAVDAAAEAQEDPLTLKEARKVALGVISAHHKSYAEMNDHPRVPDGFGEALLDAYKAEIEAAKNFIFEDFKLPRGASEKLTAMACQIATKDPLQGDSGLVIAGFGRSDVFPSLVAYTIDGVLLNHVVRWDYSRDKIRPEVNETASVQGFAQADVIHLFMEGVTQEYEAFVEGYVSQVIEQYGDIVLDGLGGMATEGLRNALRDAEAQIMSSLTDEFSARRQDLYVTPILDVVSSLPKDELGAMAESLVNLTSLKRRISMEHETVGGPIDVAVITKGDGLVWTKRKHYFDPSLNHHFFANYFKGHH